MNLDENISRIIANYIMGKITDEESENLQGWLSDSNNEQQFKKIIDEKRIAKELTQLEAIDVSKAYKEFRLRSTNVPNLKRVLSYVAAVLLPLGLGLLAIFLTTDNNHNQDIAEEVEFDNEKITIVAGDGRIHEFTGNDTLVSISNAKVIVKDKNISYKPQVEIQSTELTYNTIHIPAGKKYELKLSDGTIVHLNSQTTLKYPLEFVGSKRTVRLVSGEAFFNVEKHAKPFVLGFGVNKIKVLGTKFNVKAYDTEEREQITLEEGSISLDNSKNEIQLLPNQQAIINRKDLSMTIDEVDASLYSAWRNGFLNYREESLFTILNDIQRQFNVRVFYQNQEVKNKRLSISINTNKKITQIVRAIEATGDVKFEINNSSIIVMKK